MKKHLKKIENFHGKIFLLLSILIIYGCDEEKKPSGYLAKVEDTYLYTDDLPKYFDSTNIANKHLSELVQSWVNTEVLFREAVREGILDDPGFQKMVETAKREIASAILMKQLNERITIPPDEKETESYFNTNKAKFELGSDAYLLNYAIFGSFDKSALFRNLLFESDWNKSTTAFNEDGSLIEQKANQFFYDYKIFSGSVLKIVRELEDDEVSPIIQLDSSKYSVVQIVKKYRSGEVPEYSLIKNSVQKIFLEEKKRIESDRIIQQLFSKYDIEIVQ